MKVVTLKNIPESARTWRGRTDGWIFRARAHNALNRSGHVAIPANGRKRRFVSWVFELFVAYHTGLPSYEPSP